MFLLWLLRASGPWHHFADYRAYDPIWPWYRFWEYNFYDVSDTVIYFDYAQKVAAGTARLQGLLVRVPAAGAAAADAAAARRRVELVPALVRRGDDPL